MRSCAQEMALDWQECALVCVWHAHMVLVLVCVCVQPLAARSCSTQSDLSCKGRGL